MSDAHKKEVQEAFEDYGLLAEADYRLIFGPLTGYRYKKIIVIGFHTDSVVETVAFERLVKEDLPTKLARGGKLYVL